MTLFDPDDFASPALREATAHLRAVTEVSTNDLVDGYWITRSASEGLTARELYSWMHESEGFDGERLLDELAEEGEVLSTAHYRRSGKTEAMVRIQGTLVNVTLSRSARSPTCRWSDGVTTGTHSAERPRSSYPADRHLVPSDSGRRSNAALVEFL